MLQFLPAPLIGTISMILYVVNTIFWCIPLFIIAFFKFIIPLKAWRKLCDVILIYISTNWIYCNNLNQNLTQKTMWDVSGLDNLKMDEWYLVLSNHQSWVDIVVLQRIFHRKIPFLKFFLKKELIWVPLLGLAWWALDFPFMQRYSKEFLEKNPHLQGKDLENTKKACEKFKSTPISIMNFVEGTRFTKGKHQKQESPYANLLKPKAGGVAFVLGAMGDVISNIVNVTIVYPKGVKTFWEFACGKVEAVKIEVDVIPISEELKGNYMNDEEFRNNFQEWINLYWIKKDRQIDMMRGKATA
ncbi:MAG: acyltransferase [Proteobacteria bacterium]|nr:acyltransferase [Pseudomonadota bacterium]